MKKHNPIHIVYIIISYLFFSYKKQRLTTTTKTMFEIIEDGKAVYRIQVNK